MAEDDPFQTSPNFVNPDYVTPQQLLQMREVAKQLLGPNQQQVMRAPQGWSNLANTLVGTLMNQQANQGQRQMLQQGQNAITGAGQQNPIVDMLRGGIPQQQGPTSASGQSAPMQPSDAPRGIRNNNPGNIEDGPFAKSVPGYAGSDGRFAIFQTPQAGQMAMDKLLQSYGNRGLNTPQAIANRWAPAGDGSNNPMAYASTVAGQMGVQPNTQLDMSDPNIRARLAAGMTQMENGRQMPQQQMAQNAPQGNQAAVAHMMMDPNVPQQFKDAAIGALTPKAIEDVYGRPGVGNLQGIRPLPVQQGFQPGYRAPAQISPEGGISTTIPMPTQGGGPKNLQQTMQPMLDTGKNFAQQAQANKATIEQQKSDFATAYAAIPVQQTLATMRDDILSHGDKMIWGPTADWVNNLRRGIAQHAPGLLTQKDLDGLASADSFEKLSAQLQTLVGRQAGGTDMSLLQGIKSVPGSHNSKEGAIALIDMLSQVASLNHQFISQNQGSIGQPGFNYLNAKNQFFDSHPLINPITKNPIRMDLEGSGRVPDQTKTINGKTYYHINGAWHEGT